MTFKDIVKEAKKAAWYEIKEEEKIEQPEVEEEAKAKVAKLTSKWKNIEEI